MRFHHLKIVFFVLVSISGFRVSAAAQRIAGPAQVAEELSRMLQARADAQLIRGAAIAQLAGDGSVSKTLFGDVHSSDDSFEIGSISKAFTGIVIAELHLEKKIDLDAPISNYLPELKGTFVGSVSAHQLGTHRARLPGPFLDASGKQNDDFSETELIQFLQNYIPDPKVYPEGEYHYSNVGFNTLGLLISRIDGSSFGDAIRQRILVPLGMGSSGFISSSTAPPGLIEGHDVNLDPVPYRPYSDLKCASGGIYSSLHDLILFLRANAKPDSRSALGASIKLGQTLGLGWDSEPGKIPVWKNGATDGFTSKLEINPDTGEGSVILNDERNVVVTMGIAQWLSTGSDTLLYPGEGMDLPSNLAAGFEGGFTSPTDQNFSLTLKRSHGQLTGAETIALGDSPVRIYPMLGSDGKPVTMAAWVDYGDGPSDYVQQVKTPDGRDQLYYQQFDPKLPGNYRTLLLQKRLLKIAINQTMQRD